MSHDYKVRNLRELDHKPFYFRYQFIKHNYRELYHIFAKYSNTKEFTNARHSLFILIFFPALVNLYYGFVSPHSIFKTPFRIAAVFGCVLNFGSQIYKDLLEVGKTDTHLGNNIKKLFQNISYEDSLAPDFGEETMKIVKKRENQEKL